MSGLLHLVEAATALTQLVTPTNLPSQEPPVSSSGSTSSPLAGPPVTTTIEDFASGLPSYSSTHNISDDDDAMANTACAKMSALRENHLQALRIAASNAAVMSAAPPQPPVPQVMAYPSNKPSRCVPQAQQASTEKVPVRGGCGPATTPVTADASKEMFPMRLHALLSDSTVRDVISWLPHGKSFVVLRPDVFATGVLPRYFAPEGSNSLNAKTTTVVGKDGSLQVKNRSPGVHKYPSFTRKLNRWGFRQISRGPDAGAFCHEMFQRDQPDLCRGMVCQKSRKSKRTHLSASGIGGGVADDMMSVSSASTLGTKQSFASFGEKRPFSSTVTVSTAGVTSDKSLPFKKRKSGRMDGFAMNDIPSMISHRNQRMTASTSSVMESDMTSDTSSVCSHNVVVPKPSPAKAPAPVVALNNASVSATHEATAMEALARHFHEQHRAFALASLMENSRLAMEAAGIQRRVNTQACVQHAPVASDQATGADQSSRKYSPVLGAVTTHSTGVFAATVSIPEEKKMPAAGIKQGPAQSATDAAKNALYKAYLHALSSHPSSSSSQA